MYSDKSTVGGMYETYDKPIDHLHRHTTRPRFGIIGGGQLAKMTGMAALQLGCDLFILDRNDYGPAFQLSAESLVGDWDDPQNLIRLASRVHVVSIENEFVSADALQVLEDKGYRVRPGSQSVRLIQDKLVQKETLHKAGLRVPRFAGVQEPQDILKLAGTLNWPVVLKARRNAYDGKGNVTIRTAAEVNEAWQRLDGARRGLYVEEFCDYAKELAVTVVRNDAGQVAEYPVVETIQQNHICRIVRAPAPIAAEVASRARDVARQAIEVMGGVGVFCVELFVTAHGAVLINEIAPRVHNSGHYTIEACVCSQFENHVRAVLGWPLGSTSMRAPAAVMVNLLGEGNGDGTPEGLQHALAIKGAHIHIYGKTSSGIGRKMGHVTAMGNNLKNAEAIALQAADAIHFGRTS